jgi:hypothetical protein
MPKKPEERLVYERCWGCDGTRKTKMAFNAGSPRELPTGSECPLCEDGYFETGLTMAQVDRWGQLARAIQDPGMENQKRKAILEKYRDRIAAAMEKL